MERYDRGVSHHQRVSSYLTASLFGEAHPDSQEAVNNQIGSTRQLAPKPGDASRSEYLVDDDGDFVMIAGWSPLSHFKLGLMC